LYNNIYQKGVETMTDEPKDYSDMTKAELLDELRVIRQSKDLTPEVWEKIFEIEAMLRFYGSAVPSFYSE